mmetsp:Transcript_10763/g.25030  ORF Transcript_10763/g.25030 Transcript_10763/m.25030 type:complete len:143 (+) Transcript_10763:44-472(+)
MCGMSEPGQHCTGIIIDQDGNIDALDTYGLTPLHRMCINDFAVGAEALLKAGASPTRRTEAGAGSELRGKTPMEIAKESKARKVVRVLAKYMARDTGPERPDKCMASPVSVSRFPMHSPISPIQHQKTAPARITKDTGFFQD